MGEQRRTLIYRDYARERVGMRRAPQAPVTNPSHPPLDDPETHAIIGAAIAVHRTMGRGFLEHVYHHCLAIEFQRQRIPYEKEVLLPITYDGVPLPVAFRADFVCYGSIIVELKALPTLSSREEAQLLNNLKAANMHRGVLLNFGSEVLGKKRRVWGLPPSADPMGSRPEVRSFDRENQSG